MPLESLGLTSPYSFARDRQAIMKGREILRHAAGNFYINDKVGIHHLLAVMYVELKALSARVQSLANKLSEVLDNLAQMINPVRCLSSRALPQLGPSKKTSSSQKLYNILPILDHLRMILSSQCTCNNLSFAASKLSLHLASISDQSAIPDAESLQIAVMSWSTAHLATERSFGRRASSF